MKYVNAGTNIKFIKTGISWVDNSFNPLHLSNLPETKQSDWVDSLGWHYSAKKKTVTILQSGDVQLVLSLHGWSL